ncbi:MAG TPA: 2-C-methyl-D-erythritol 4-phosphate cytidylyltransferase [Actinomycetales bacterium]|nr:2-C-methyl-D-erythritol 4-phosphate cytidylyltransferase [Actinomycetales bacterium]
MTWTRESVVRAATVRYVVPVLPYEDEAAGSPLATTHLHGRPLFAHAVSTVHEAAGRDVLVTAPVGAGSAVSAALGDTGARVVEGGGSLGACLQRVLADVSSEGRPQLLVVHDPRCPLVPAAFLREVVDRATARPYDVTVATRPMTDTVKSVVDGVVRATVDRDRLVVLTSPLVVPVDVLAPLSDEPALRACVDVEDLVLLARSAGAAVHWVPAPSLAWRVDDVSSVSVLESVTDGGRRPR